MDGQIKTLSIDIMLSAVVGNSTKFLTILYIILFLYWYITV